MARISVAPEAEPGAAAPGVRLKFEALSDAEKKQLLDFLKSL